MFVQVRHLNEGFEQYFFNPWTVISEMKVVFEESHGRRIWMAVMWFASTFYYYRIFTVDNPYYSQTFISSLLVVFRGLKLSLNYASLAINNFD